jgi:hypothetical protein
MQFLIEGMPLNTPSGKEPARMDLQRIRSTNRNFVPQFMRRIPPVLNPS